MAASAAVVTVAVVVAVAAVMEAAESVGKFARIIWLKYLEEADKASSFIYASDSQITPTHKPS